MNERADPCAPPLFGEAPARECSRWTGEHNCGRTPVMHVCWTDDGENGFVCREHVDELGVVWAFVQAHRVSSDCGMPGAMWFANENTCRCPDTRDEGEQEAAAEASSVVAS